MVVSCFLLTLHEFVTLCYVRLFPSHFSHTRRVSAVAFAAFFGCLSGTEWDINGRKAGDAWEFCAILKVDSIDGQDSEWHVTSTWQRTKKLAKQSALAHWCEQLIQKWPLYRVLRCGSLFLVYPF